MIFNARPFFWVCENRASHISKSWEKRYSSSLKVVKETVTKCRISQKSWCVESDIRNFRDKNGDARKVLTFLTHKSKPGVVQTMLVLVKVLSGLYHSYPLTQLAFLWKCLCKYYISMISATCYKSEQDFETKMLQKIKKFDFDIFRFD